MLSGAVQSLAAERGVSVRSLGKQLGYKQATVISHMASGRVLVPLERAPEIARAVYLDPGDFLTAAVEQRSREATELLQLRSRQDDRVSFGLVSDLEVIADRPISQLTGEHKAILREVVADARPTRRWLTLAELPVIEMIRELRPEFGAEGLTAGDATLIRDALSKRE